MHTDGKPEAVSDGSDAVACCIPKQWTMERGGGRAGENVTHTVEKRYLMLCILASSFQALDRLVYFESMATVLFTC